VILMFYNIGAEIVRDLTKESDLCARFDKDIHIGDQLDEGSYSIVSEVLFPGGERYVIKEYKDVKVETVTEPKPISLKAFMEAREEEFDENLFVLLNGGDVNAIRTEFKVPEFSAPCVRNVELRYKSNTSEGKFRIRPPFYLCESSQYPEYILGLLTSNLYRSGECYHFVDVVDFITCVKSRRESDDAPKQYLLMEMVDKGTLEWEINGDFSVLETEADTESVTLQVLFAIACYQTKYGISHNDLKMSNIFVQRREGVNNWHKQDIAHAKYFHYRVKGIDLYCRAYDLIKIGDWGVGIKWAPPVIGQRAFVLGSEDRSVPNSYVASFDLLYFLFSLVDERSPLSLELFEYATGTVYNDNTFIPKEWMQPRFPRRPSLDILNTEPMKDVTALKILKNEKLMSRFRQKPDSDKIVTLGTLA